MSYGKSLLISVIIIIAILALTIALIFGVNKALVKEIHTHEAECGEVHFVNGADLCYWECEECGKVFFTILPTK